MGQVRLEMGAYGKARRLSLAKIPPPATTTANSPAPKKNPKLLA